MFEFLGTVVGHILGFVLPFLLIFVLLNSTANDIQKILTLLNDHEESQKIRERRFKK